VKSGLKILCLWSFTLTCLCHGLVQASLKLVGPSRQYTSLQQLAETLLPGDTVLVDGDVVYNGGIKFDRPGSPSARIVIIGVNVNGNRPIVDGSTNAVAFIDGADHYTFENFEVRNATFRGIYHQSDDLIIRNVVVHDCDNGLMGSDNGSGTLLLEYSEFYRNGSGTQAHQIYMATDEEAHPGSVFRMQFCYIHDGTGGNNVKSRAERNEIYYNWIEGAVYHELELIGPDPAGGVAENLKREDSDVVGDVLWKKTTPSGGQANFYVVRFGGDGTGQSFGRYRFVNNTVIMGSSVVFRLFDGIESVEMHNNVFHRPGGGAAPLVRTVEADWSTGETIAGQNNWVHSDLTNVPSQWTGTLKGTDPMFVNFSAGNLTPSSGDPLVDAGTSDPQSPPGFPFPSPLFPPMFEPPTRMLGSPGSAAVRAADGHLDIGAFEWQPSTDVTEPLPLPGRAVLQQNYPNPFNAVTVVSYRLSVASDVKLIVYDIVGREVAVLVKEREGPGRYEARFDGTWLSSGVYFYKLEAGSFVQTRKLVLLR
jgi:hypothetical protein